MIARQIAKVILLRGEGMTAALARLIDSGPEPSEIARLLELWPAILAECMGKGGLDSLSLVKAGEQFAPFDLLYYEKVYTTESWNCRCVSFLPSVNSLETDFNLHKFLSYREDAIRKLYSNASPLKKFFTTHDFDSSHYFSAVVFYGRRDALSEWAKAIGREHSDISVHSYDRLLEASVKLAR